MSEFPLKSIIALSAFFQSHGFPSELNLQVIPCYIDRIFEECVPDLYWFLRYLPRELLRWYLVCSPFQCLPSCHPKDISNWFINFRTCWIYNVCRSIRIHKNPINIIDPMLINKDDSLWIFYSVENSNVYFELHSTCIPSTLICQEIVRNATDYSINV